MLLKRLLPLLVLGILFAGSSVQATTYFWTTSSGAGGNGVWDTTAANNWGFDTSGNTSGLINWTTTGTDTAEFYTGSGAVTVNNTQSVGNINFDAGTSYALSGGTLNMSASGGSINVSSGGAATIGSVINGSTLTLAGSGTLTLAGALSYTGPTVISGGTLKLSGVPTGYVGYYDFTGGTANNGVSGGSAYNGALFGAAAISGAGGLNGGPCMTLPSSGTASGLYLGSAGIPVSNGAFTASLWFYGLYDDSNYRGSFQSWANESSMYILGADSNQNLEAWSGGFKYASTPFSMAPYTNQAAWHMLTIVGDGSISTYYVDGTQAGSPLNNPNWVLTSNIGQVGGQEDQSARNFAQKIDDVYVYQTALTASQVQQLYAFSPAGSTAASLPAGTTVSIAGGAQLDLNGFSQQVAALSDSVPGSGGSVINSTAATPVVLTLSATGGTATFSGAIAGGGGLGAISLTISGNGTQILAGANTYTGSTTICGGVLQASNTGALPGYSTAGKITVNSGGTLLLSAGGSGWSGGDIGNLNTGGFQTGSTLGIDTTGGSTTVSTAIAGSEGLIVQGNNTLSLTAVNTYTGGTTVNAGTLALAGYGSNTGTILGALTINSGGTVNADDWWALGIGNGASHPCVDSITINGGVLNFTGAPGKGGTSATNITMTGGTISGNAFDWYRGITTTPTLSTNFSSETAVISSGLNIRVGGDVTFNVASGTTSNGMDLLISGPIGSNGGEGGGIIKSGAGLLCLSGANSYAGSTTISDGVLQLGNGGATGSLPTGSAIIDNGNLTFSRSNAVTQGTDFSGSAISGTGSVTQAGTGVLTLNATNAYSGGTMVNAGTLQLGAVLALGSTSGNLAVNSSAVLDLHGYSPTVGALSGAGTINSLAGGSTLTVGAGDASSAFGGAIQNGSSSTAVVALVKTGAGTLVLTGSNTYIGGTTVNGGTLQLGDGTANNGSIVGNAAVSSNATINFANPHDQTYAGSISGSGGLTKSGVGALTLVGGNSYTGPTVISGGILKLSGELPGGYVGYYGFTGGTANNGVSGGSAYNGALFGAAAISSTGGLNGGPCMTLPSSGTASGLYLGSAGIPVSNGAFTASLWFYGLYDDSNYRGSFQSWANESSMYILGADSNQNLEAWSGGFKYASTPFSMAPYTNQAAWHMLTIVGDGSISTYYVDGTQAGSPLNNPNWVLTSNIGQVGGQEDQSARNFAQKIDDVYVYQTALTASQVQQLYDLSPAGPTATNLPAGTTVSIASGAQLDLNGASQQVAFLSDSIPGSGGAVTNSGATASVLTLSAAGGTAIFSGAIQDGNAQVSLIMAGSGVQVLAGSNTYSGATTISSGTLQIGNGGSGESLASPTISNSGALVFNHADTLTYAGAISGSGQLTEQGGGMLILSGNNTYTGPTTVNAGTLQIGNGTSGEGLTSSITMSNNATVAFNHADALSYGGAISGSGQLIKLGTGNLDLVGSGTYSGPTTISAGTLELDGNGDNLPAATALTIAASGVLDLAGNPLTVGSLSGSAGAVVTNRYPSYASTLTVAPSSGSTTFAGNIIGNNALALSGSGELTLSGTNTYTGGTTVSGGTLDIAAPSALAGSGLVTVAAGGRLVLGSGAGIGALLTASTPVGSSEAALSAAVSVPATLGGYESASENMATLGGAPPLSQGGGGSAVGGSVAAVPEPGTIALFTAGVLAIAVASRLQQRRRQRG